jgi:hypothetical protein
MVSNRFPMYMSLMPHTVLTTKVFSFLCAIHQCNDDGDNRFLSYQIM